MSATKYKYQKNTHFTGITFNRPDHIKATDQSSLANNIIFCCHNYDFE